MEDMTLIPSDQAKTLCPWLVNSKVPVPLLSDWNDPLRDSADWWIEDKIGKLVSGFMNTELAFHSAGNFPEYDIGFKDGNLIEIKISTFQSDKKLFIETHKEVYTDRDIVKKKEPSGLSLSTANFYILLSPGRTKVGDAYKDVMKIRLVSVFQLRKLAETTVEISIGQEGSKRSFGFDIDLHDPDFNDGCLGHFKYNAEHKTIDFGSFTPYRKEIAKAAAEYRSPLPIPGVTIKG